MIQIKMNKEAILSFRCVRRFSVRAVSLRPLSVSMQRCFGVLKDTSRVSVHPDQVPREAQDMKASLCSDATVPSPCCVTNASHPSL